METSYEGQPGPLPHVEVPSGLTMQTPFGIKDEFYIYSWEDRVEKSRFFDFGDFLNARDIENNWVLTLGLSLVFGVISV